MDLSNGYYWQAMYDLAIIVPLFWIQQMFEFHGQYRVVGLYNSETNKKFKEIEKNTKNLVRNFVYSVNGKLLKWHQAFEFKAWNANAIGGISKWGGMFGIYEFSAWCKLYYCNIKEFAQSYSHQKSIG